MKRNPSRARRRRPEAAPAPSPPRSRRDFMRLLAAGSAALLATPAAAPAQERSGAASRQRRTRTAPAAPRPGAHPMLPAELEKQKKSLADSLKTLRAYELPPGHPPALVFRPLAQKPRGRASS